jgi:O-antigen/teichoic acid export membrane protein
MIAPNLLPVIFATIVLLLFNPVITTVFIYSRWNIKSKTASKRRIISLTTFILTFILFLLLQLLFKHSIEIWTIVYALTMSAFVIGDRIAKRKIEKNK